MVEKKLFWLTEMLLVRLKKCDCKCYIYLHYYCMVTENK